MFHLQHTPGRTAIVDGKEYLFFSGYSYLGMNHVPEFSELVKEGGDKYGWLFPSSRISNTQLDIYEPFEAKLSEITGTETSVCFSSGFLAGKAVIELLKTSNLHCAPHTHPAIAVNKPEAGSFPEWVQKIVPLIKESDVLVFDSVNPLSAEINDLSFLDSITQNITCVIDDSHGIGLLNNGKGIGASLPQKENIRYIITCSLSKAFNIIGGAVNCSKDFAQQLKRTEFYTASTSLSPAFAYAFLKGQNLYQQQREKLGKNIEIFRRLTGNIFHSRPELPIFILPLNIDEKKLEASSIMISSFAYPDPSGEKIKRIILNALHREVDLELLIKILNIIQ